MPHNHNAEDDRIDEARQKGLLTLKSLSEAAKEYDEKASLKIELVAEEPFIQ